MSPDALRPTLRQLAIVAQQHVSMWMQTTDAGRDEIRAELAAVMAPYAESAALLAADWYMSQEGAPRFKADPVALLTDERAENTANWIFKGPQTPESRLRSAAQSMVWDAARNTVLVNAGVEGVAVVRHAQASAANDCIARATVIPTQSTASSDAVPRDFRHNCRCLYLPVRKGTYVPPEYTDEWRLRIRDAHRAGNTTPEAVANWLDAH